MELEFSVRIFINKYKFHENPSSGSRVVAIRSDRQDRRTDMTKLIVAFRSFAEVRNETKES